MDALEIKIPNFASTPADEATGEEGTAGVLIGNTRVLIPETHFNWLESYRLVVRQRSVYDLQRVGKFEPIIE